jgi:hypothetical protein
VTPGQIQSMFLGCFSGMNKLAMRCRVRMLTAKKSSLVHVAKKDLMYTARYQLFRVH